MPKQEYETCLYGAEMGPKDDPRICLRGKLDALHAKAVLCATDIAEQGDMRLSVQVEQIATMALALLEAEYKGELAALPLLDGKTEEQIHSASHFPERHTAYRIFSQACAQGVKLHKSMC